MPTTPITTSKAADDQYFLLLGEEVIGMVVNLAGGGWLWALVSPFVTGIENGKERAGVKLLEIYEKFGY